MAGADRCTAAGRAVGGWPSPRPHAARSPGRTVPEPAAPTRDPGRLRADGPDGDASAAARARPPYLDPGRGQLRGGCGRRPIRRRLDSPHDEPSISSEPGDVCGRPRGVVRAHAASAPDAPWSGWGRRSASGPWSAAAWVIRRDRPGQPLPASLQESPGVHAGDGCISRLLLCALHRG